MTILKTAACQTINLQGKLMSFDVPKIMGILNLTPDSFYDGGQHNAMDAALKKTSQLIEQGADIIDIGAYSSRPGAALISVQEEIDRAVPVIERIKEKHPNAILSIDTFRADVALHAVRAGAHLINDISAGMLDEDMFGVLADLQVPYIAMHMRGTPETMQQFTDYADIVEDIACYFGDRIAQLRALGVKDIILDPGFGFSKTITQNYELLERIHEFQYLQLPIVAGISRKSMIYKKLGITAHDALSATTALNTLLLSKGVQLLRVHDVLEAKQLVKLFYNESLETV